MRKANKNHVLAVRIYDGDWSRLQAVAKAEGCKTPSQYVRKILSIGTHTLFGRRRSSTPRRAKKQAKQRPG